MMDLMSATIEQQGAIDNATDNNLIVALPGSGKSFTLTEIAKAIFAKTPNVKLTFVTFTNLATRDMQKKLKKKLPLKHFNNCTVSTFHSLFLKQSKKHMKGQLLIGGAHSNMVIRTLRALGLDIEFKDACSIIDTYGRQLSPDYDPENVDSLLYRTYKKLLNDNGKYDLNDVAKFVCKGLLDQSIDPIESDYNLIDEAQDIDALQSLWVSCHGQAGIKQTLVGDDDQQIYSWRGANGYEAMISFRDEFDAQTHILSECFRCRPEILGAAQILIEHNKTRIPKSMSSAKEEGGIVEIHELIDAEEQYELLSSMILENPWDWVVLARTNLSLRECEAYLSFKGIKTNMMGGKSIWDDPRADAFLKTLYSIRYVNDNRYLNEVLGYLGEHEEIINSINYNAKAAKGFYRVMYDTSEQWKMATLEFQAFCVDETLNIENKIVIANRFNKIIDIIKKSRPSKEKSNTGIEDFIVGLCDKVEGDWNKKLESMIKLLVRFKSKVEDEEKVLSDIVDIGTFHGAKGLEWKNVAIIDVNQDKIPSSSTVALEKSDYDAYLAAMEEERRLVFVGMTRAENELHMFSHGGPKNISSLLLEIKEGAKVLEEA
jgi:DNA helicase-2/ATP-dependent DNA helicase PcrA